MHRRPRRISRAGRMTGLGQLAYITGALLAWFAVSAVGPYLEPHTAALPVGVEDPDRPYLRGDTRPNVAAGRLLCDARPGACGGVDAWQLLDDGLLHEVTLPSPHTPALIAVCVHLPGTPPPAVPVMDAPGPNSDVACVFGVRRPRPWEPPLP